MGLPSNAPLCTFQNTSCGPREETGSRIRTRIIPEIFFTCSGTVTGWRAAGEIRSGGSAITNSVLSIWRERSSGSGTYDRVSGIELGICGTQDPAPLVMSNIYECILPQTVSVQPGYIVGIELPQEGESKFRLYFNSQGGQTNYVFGSHGTTFSLSQALSFEETDQPQISLTIVPDIATTVLPTIQPSTTTEVSSTVTMASLITQPPVTSTSIPIMATIYTTEFPSQSTTDQAPTTVSSTEAPTPPPTDSRATPQDSTSGLTSTSIDLANPPQSGSGDNSALIGGIIGAVSAIGALVPLFLIVTIFLMVLLIKRRSQRLYNVPTPQPQTDIDSTIYSQIIDSQSIEVKNNEAYSLSPTQQIPTEDNVAYSSLIPTVDNAAYGQVTSQIPTEDNVAYGKAAASQLHNNIITEDNVAYGHREDDYVTVSDPPSNSTLTGY